MGYHKCWNDFLKKEERFPTSQTLSDLRNPSCYWIVSDAQLKRDLKPRTLEDIYRENRAYRRGNDKYQPRTAKVGTAGWDNLLYEYILLMKAKHGKRKWAPHPASIDPEHEIAKQRESIRNVKRH